jgi:predicted dehydrogenase
LIRWGFLGAGFIAARALAPAVHAAEGSVLQSVAARDIHRGEQLAPVRAYTEYEAVLEDPDVDAVYISLTNEAHLSWVQAALAAGKHVLCEKPLGLDAPEVARMFQRADAAGRLLVEATMYRWHPRTRRAEELVRSGAIGEVTGVDASFTFDGVPEGNYRLEPERGGGAWYDVGCYTVSAARWALGRDLGDPDGVARRDLPGGVDGSMEAQWSDPPVRLRASIMDAPEQRVLIRGTRGELDLGHMAAAFTAWHEPAELRLSAADGDQVEAFPAVDPYEEMVRNFTRRLAGEEAWVLPAAESLGVAATMDAVRAWSG